VAERGRVKLNPLKGKVLRIFGLVIRPANWFIFIAGLALMVLAPYLWLRTEQDWLTVLILFIQGVQLLVEGYGEVKDDEDIEPGDG
jgi:lysylphosphatidylglycerol synthetase-like protein (DUF2156 family)